MGPLELLKKVVAEFEHLKIPYIVTGSLASMAYGEPRLTNDIDIVAAINDRHNEVDMNYISDWAKRLGLTEIWEAIQRRMQEK